MAAMICSFRGGAVLTSRSVSRSCISDLIVGCGLLKTSLKGSVHFFSCSSSVMSSLPCLSTIRM